jgi:DNA-binding PucR family transcriptional regulator
MAELPPTFGTTYRREIVDYLMLDERTLYEDVVVISMENLRVLLDNVQSGELVGSRDLETFRESAARRFHQGISLEALLHAYRLWCRIVWRTILDCTRADLAEERDAALGMTERVIEHMNLVSTAVAQAYLEEAQGVWHDRELLRRDLLEALIAGRVDSEQVRAHARALNVTLAPNYLVAVVRRVQSASAASRGPLSERAEMRRVVERLKAHLADERPSVLIGLRHDEIVVLYPAPSPKSVDAIREQGAALGAVLQGTGFCVGLGGWHHGPEGTAASYAEAKEAAGIAAGQGVEGRAIPFDSIAPGHVLRSNPRSHRLLSEALGLLHEYDREHGATLVPTLGAYLRTGFNITRSAKELHVHPNTVVYRLRRIRELTGRDPTDPNDLLLLCVGLKVAELETALRSSL